MEKYHIVLSIDDKTGEYSKFAGITITSIFENTSCNVCIHLFHSSNLSEKNKNNFNKICKKYNQEIQYHKMEVSLKIKNMKMIKEGFLSEGSLYRLNIIEELKNLNKVLYLDCDIVINDDIKKIFNIDIKNFCLGAVHDIGIDKNYKFYKKNMPCFNTKEYFNAGVIIFNLDKIRKLNIDLLREAISFFEKYPKDPFTDQSALNYIFKNNILLIDNIYNMFPKRNSKIEDAMIWHFAGANKPWKTRFSEVDKLFWKYYRLSPWGEDIDALLNMYSKVVDSLDYALLYYPSGPKRQFFKNVFIRIYREIKEIKKNYL